MDSSKVAVLLGASEKEAEVEMAEVTEFMLKFGQLCNKHISVYYSRKSEIETDGLESLSESPPSIETVEEMEQKYPEVKSEVFVNIQLDVFFWAPKGAPYIMMQNIM